MILGSCIWDCRTLINWNSHCTRCWGRGVAGCHQFSLTKWDHKAVNQQESGFFRFQFLVISPPQKRWKRKNVRRGMWRSKKWARKEIHFFMTGECALDKWVLSASQCRFSDSSEFLLIWSRRTRLKITQTWNHGPSKSWYQALGHGFSKHFSSLKLVSCLWDQDRASCQNRGPLSQRQSKISGQSS